ncbi:uroporphyrinogen III synthetase [Actinoplanes sp. SE50]|uniref:uroporphyrinogen-III synthase n=1 Tax=unclassified Actinoplanes TaxID=2626549 RepID=UPI00023ED551|nr:MULTISPECIES: uroporphyrinogen-III synthase [unclassified Actinoplanes]AEV81729.1 uroporphyrinogen-III synthase [Actinoplanes sp. SE50/110]ATO80130.1 uroporphyrinogen III synthetase [Actinoplanes sp. SE50]SLL97534.1 bifunctional uroporphyrinogen-III synthetase/response regulator domain protein [Actinoplanes sp. SE50/110]
MTERIPAARRSALDEPAAVLAGYTVGVTSDRRRDELAALLEGRGARVVLAPALRIVPIADDAELRAATRACLDSPPDIVLVSTGIGMRGWLEAAESWGLAEPLRAVLDRSYLVARGPKARAAVRTAGLRECWTPEGESSAEVVEHLTTRGLGGLTVALQLHGESQPEYTEVLRAAGARVIELPVYRWAPPTDTAPLHRLVDLIAGRLVDAVTFTSAAAVHALLRAAGPAVDPLLDALRSDVLAACVGPVTAEPLRRLEIPVTTPARARLSALVRTLTDELPQRAVSLQVNGHAITLRGHAAVIDGRLRQLAPAPMAVLRALATSPGRVLSRAALLQTLPRHADEHAVEMAVARLRAAIPGIVQTVVKRGYRIAG